MTNEDVEIELSAAHVELMSLDDVEVAREWHNIDLLVTSRREKWCLLIENKIHSRESPGQLLRYIEEVRREMSGFDVLPVFLTLEGDDPSQEGAKRDTSRSATRRC